MLDKGKIGSLQAVFLLVSMVLPTALLYISAHTSRHAGQDGWISLMLAVFAALAIARLAVSLARRFPGQTLFQFPEHILGRWPGKAVAVLYVWWFFHMNAEIIRQFGNFLVAAFMTHTPLIVFELLIVLIAAYAVRGGLEVFTRANQIILPFILGLIIITNILIAPEIDLKKLLPVFSDSGAVPVLKGAVMPASWLGEIVIVAVLLPYLDRGQKAFKIAVTATLITGLILLITFVTDIALFSPQLTVAALFPELSKVRIISLGNFLERLEAITMGIWIAGGLIKISLFYWAAVLGSAQCLELKDYRPLVLPAGVILLALSVMLHENIIEQVNFLGAFWGPYALFLFQTGIPLFLLAAAAARGLGGQERQ
jgi:spore germination protein KB